MAKIKKIYDDSARTTQIYPQTHEKAVVDNNGTTAETKFGLLQEAYSALTQSDIVVVADHTAVSSPQANVIYREQGTTTYSDWMYYDSSWKKMAEYDNATDDVPTVNSNNLVKSGGVYESIPTMPGDASGVDLEIADPYDNALVRFAGGNIQTKNFDSTGVNTKLSTIEVGAQENDVVVDNTSEENVDLDVADEDDSVVLRIYNGNIKTKNFDSHGVNEKLAGIEAGAEANDVETIDGSNGDFEISDEEDNVIARFTSGHIKTRNFDSSKIDIGYLGVIEKRYQGKKLSILGDSISTFGGSASDAASSRISDGTWTYEGNRCRYPQSNLFTDVSKQYWYKLLQATGMLLGINESWAGSRVSNTSSTDHDDVGPTRHIASMTRISHLGEGGTPDLILVYAGTNDVGHNVTIGTFDTSDPTSLTEEEIAELPVDTFANAYRTMLIRLQYYYPTSEIVCCFPNYTTSYYNTTQLDSYNEIVRDACDFFGIKYIDLRTAGITMMNRNTYLPDGIHPNASGMERIFNCIYKHLIFE